MKKFISVVLVLICLGWIVNCSPNGKSAYSSSQDTIINIWGDGDSMFFVVNENQDTIDWWGYSQGVRIGKKQFGEIKAVVDTLAKLQHVSKITGKGKSLNDIRFADFKDEDWLDNDYIRCLRMYIDDYKNGKVEDSTLDKYKDKIQGQFVIGSAEPYLLGGLFIQFIFVDSPSDIFSVWVYSEVDEDTERVTGYSTRGITFEDENSGFTKERILELVKEHPELKLW